MAHCSFCKRPCSNSARFCAYCGSGVIHDLPEQTAGGNMQPSYRMPQAQAYTPVPSQPKQSKYWQAPKDHPSSEIWKRVFPFAIILGMLLFLLVLVIL